MLAQSLKNDLSWGTMVKEIALTVWTFGGGFILGFTQDFEKAESLLKEHKLQVIYKM